MLFLTSCMPMFKYRNPQSEIKHVVLTDGSYVTLIVQVKILIYTFKEQPTLIRFHECTQFSAKLTQCNVMERIRQALRYL